MPIDEALLWFHGIAAGVAYLHDRGIVHRDLKPGNIFNDEGMVKIGDYGLSKFISASRRSGQTESVGTVHYMAPEIANGRYGKEIDLYALGVILYELLSGQVPFEGESVGEVLMKHLTAEPDVSRVPEAFRAVVARALAKDPQQRPHSVAGVFGGATDRGYGAPRRRSAALATATRTGTGRDDDSAQSGDRRLRRPSVTPLRRPLRTGEPWPARPARRPQPFSTIPRLVDAAAKKKKMLVAVAAFVGLSTVTQMEGTTIALSWGRLRNPGGALFLAACDSSAGSWQSSDRSTDAAAGLPQARCNASRHGRRPADRQFRQLPQP